MRLDDYVQAAGADETAAKEKISLAGKAEIEFVSEQRICRATRRERERERGKG